MGALAELFVDTDVRETDHGYSDSVDISRETIDAVMKSWLTKTFDPNQPRDDHGKWVSTGAIEEASRSPEKAKELRERVTDPKQREKLDRALAAEEKTTAAIGTARPSSNEAEFRGIKERMQAASATASELRSQAKAIEDGMRGTDVKAKEIAAEYPDNPTDEQAKEANDRINALYAANGKKYDEIDKLKKEALRIETEAALKEFGDEKSARRQGEVMTSGLSYEEMVQRFGEDRTNEAFQEARNREREWKNRVLMGITWGAITPEIAERLGVGFSDLRQGKDGYEPITGDLYHVTTAIDPVLEQGLKTREQLRQSEGKGLGGGAENTISFTHDKNAAIAIRNSMVEAHQVVNGQKTEIDMMREAVKGRYANDILRSIVNVDAPFDPTILDDRERAMRELPTPWTDAIYGMRTERSMLSKPPSAPGNWVPHPSDEGWVDGEGNRRYHVWTRPLDPDELAESRMSLFKKFAFWRQTKTGQLDPLFIFNDTQGFAKIDPSQIKIVHAVPKAGIFGYQVPAEKEWRLHDGQAVDIVGVIGADGQETTGKSSSSTLKWAEKKFKNQDTAKAFTNWFKDSRAVNPNGEPMVLYHGTTKEFDQFQTDAPNSYMFDRALGAHFAEDPSVTETFSIGQYAWPDSYNVSDNGDSWYKDRNGELHYDGIPVVVNDKTKEVEPYDRKKHGGTWGIRDRFPDSYLRVLPPGGKTMPVYLSITNPLVVEPSEREMDQSAIPRAVGNIVFPHDRQLFVDAFANTGRNYGGEVWDAIKAGKTYDGGEYEKYSSFQDVTKNFSGLLSGDVAQRAKQSLMAMGYDGVKYRNTSGNEVKGEATNPWAWIAFRPEQIKSAVGNKQFSPENPKITKSHRARDSRGRFIKKTWSETDHPRDDHGRFVSAGEISAAAGDPEKAKELEARVTDPEQRKKLDAAIDDAKSLNVAVESTAGPEPSPNKLSDEDIKRMAMTSFRGAREDATHEEKMAWVDQYNGLDKLSNEAKRDMEFRIAKEVQKLELEEYGGREKAWEDLVRLQMAQMTFTSDPSIPVHPNPELAFNGNSWKLGKMLGEVEDKASGVGVSHEAVLRLMDSADFEAMKRLTEMVKEDASWMSDWTLISIDTAINKIGGSGDADRLQMAGGREQMWDLRDAVRDAVTERKSRYDRESRNMNRSELRHLLGSLPPDQAIHSEVVRHKLINKVEEFMREPPQEKMTITKQAEFAKSAKADYRKTLEGMHKMFLATQAARDNDRVKEQFSNPEDMVRMGYHDSGQEVRLVMKEDISAEIGKRLSTEKVSRLQLKALSEVFGQTRAKDRSGSVEVTVASEVLDQWAGSAGDSDENSVMIQHAVAEEFGLTPKSFGGVDEHTFARGKELYDEHRDAMRAVVRSIYENTQEQLEKHGIKEMVLFRGMTFTRNDMEGLRGAGQGDAAETVFDLAKQDANSKIGRVVDAKISGNPISSYSWSPDTAADFMATSEAGAMVVARVPAKDIFSTALTGQGCLIEHEVLVVGGEPRDAKMAIVKGTEKSGMRVAGTHAASASVILDAIANAGKKAAEETIKKSWNETDHPRDDHGRFVSSGEIAAAATDPIKAKELESRVTNPEQRQKLDAAISAQKSSGSPEENVAKLVDMEVAYAIGAKDTNATADKANTYVRALDSRGERGVGAMNKLVDDVRNETWKRVAAMDATKMDDRTLLLTSMRVQAAIDELRSRDKFNPGDFELHANLEKVKDSVRAEVTSRTKAAELKSTMMSMAELRRGAWEGKIVASVYRRVLAGKIKEFQDSSVPRSPISLSENREFAIEAKKSMSAVKNMEAMLRPLLKRNGMEGEMHEGIHDLGGYEEMSDIRKELKAEVSQEVGNSLATWYADVPDETWKSLLKDLERGGVASDLHSDLHASVVSAVIGQWSESAGDSHPSSAMIQLAVADRFGMPVEKLAGVDESTMEKAREMYSKNSQALKLVIEMIYHNTQERLKEAGVESMTVYRGMGFNSAVLDGRRGIALGDAAEKMLDMVKNKPNGLGDSFVSDVSLESNPLSSYSWSVGTAIDFSRGEVSTLVAAIVPREQIFSIPMTGQGCLTEHEVVVLGAPKKAKLVAHGFGKTFGRDLNSRIAADELMETIETAHVR